MEEKKVKVTIHCGDYLDDVLRTLDWIIRNRKELNMDMDMGIRFTTHLRYCECL